jgi:prolyl-tRNA editing enzyme YbaK/EbsC (Cys-tRNA(Pro) deacylase)
MLFYFGKAAFENEQIDKYIQEERVNSEAIIRHILVKKCLFEKVWNHNYLLRHAIYFEQNQISKIVGETRAYLGRKLNTVVELNSSAVLHSVQFAEKYDNAYLFNSSPCARKVLTDSNRFPSNVYFHLCPTRPGYISENHPDLDGNVDLVIAGFGAASTMAYLEDYLRHISAWLSENGKLFISFINRDSIAFANSFSPFMAKPVIHTKFPQIPLFQVTNETDSAIRVKTYSIEEAKQCLMNYFESVEYMTYPFLSCLLPSDLCENMTLRNEIRNIDKQYGIQQKQIAGIETESDVQEVEGHGHYIVMVASKLKKVYDTFESVKEMLRKKNIQHVLLTHHITAGCKELEYALNETQSAGFAEGIIKTAVVRLIKRADSSQRDKILFVIMPANVRIDRKSFLAQHADMFQIRDIELVSRRDVIRWFGIGSISPLVFSLQMEEDGVNTLFLYDERIRELGVSDVYFSAGDNRKTIKMQLSVFLALLDSKHIGSIRLQSNT